DVGVACGQMKPPERSVAAVELVARKSTFDPFGMWNDLAHPPQLCNVSVCHVVPQLTRASTLMMAWLPATLACTHHSLPLTLVNVASKPGGGGGGFWPAKAMFQTWMAGQQKPV